MMYHVVLCLSVLFLSTCYVECIVQYVSWLVKCECRGVAAAWWSIDDGEGQLRSLRWIEGGEGWTRRLGRGTKRPRTHHGRLALGAWKSKSIQWSWVMKALIKLKAEVGQVKTKRCECFVDHWATYMEVGDVSTLVSHA